MRHIYYPCIVGYRTRACRMHLEWQTYHNIFGNVYDIINFPSTFTNTIQLLKHEKKLIL